MTRYTVLWDVALENHFTDAWVKSDSATRLVLTSIAQWIDQNLAVDPEQKGLAQPEPNERVAFVPISAARVSVRYRINTDDRQVRVIRLTFKLQS